MSMLERDLTQMPTDISQLGQKLLPTSNRYRIIGEQLADILRDEQFASLYEPTGRLAISPSILALVTLFQFLENVPDREAAEMVPVRLDWKYALHLSLDYPGFDYSCLCYFRKRVLAQHQERLLFDAVLAKAKALGFVKKRGKQRTDSLAVIGAVREMSNLETVTESMRMALRALLKAQPEWVARELPASYLEQYVNTKPDYRLGVKERQALLEQTGQDGYWLQDRLGGPEPPAGPELEEVRALSQVWEQRYERVEGKVRVRQDRGEGGELIVNPHDVGVRAGKKRGKGWLGDKVHVTETTEARGQNFITDVTTVPASSRDVAALEEIRGNLRQRELSPSEQYVDAGYISGKQMAQSEQEGIELIGPALLDTSTNELKIEDFALDQERKRATCPAGHSSVKWTLGRERDGSEALRVQFEGRICAECELRGRCTKGQGGRSLHIGEHYQRLQERRAEAQTDEFKQKMKSRVGIEATLSELVREHGLRRHRYRGDAKRIWENLMKGAACNLKRLAKAVIGEKRSERHSTSPEARARILVPA